MRTNPSRLAWTVLWTAFILFCVLAVSIPLGVRAYLMNAFEDQEARLQRIAGTPLVRREENGLPFGVPETATVLPGDQIVISEGTRAILDLFERSHITLYSNTTFSLDRAGSPRFRTSDRPNEVSVTLTSGRVSIGRALAGERDTRFTVLTPQTSVLLDEGSYRVQVTPEGTEVTVLRGRAVVGSDPTGLVLSDGMRSSVDAAGTIVGPMPTARNLVRNGDFQEPLETAWITSTIVYTTAIQPGHVSIVEDGGRRAARLFRLEPDDGTHTEVIISQKLDQDVRDFRRIGIALDVLVRFQSLSGGGQQSSEFPVIVRLDYRDEWGNNHFWTHGFYYQNQAGYAIATDAWGNPLGEQIAQDVWYSYESGNLSDLLGDSRPMYLISLEIYASGWNYDSLISDVQLIVE
ncbi:MAG: FecR domain-containing protein [Anaerolineae bacterium]|nr:FecR domain-containing protein [Anaerolineae bacterium]